MVSKKLMYSILTVIAVLLLVWWFRPNDKQAIRRHLQTFSELSEKTGAEPGVEALTKAARIAELFTDPCRFTFEEYDRTAEFNKKTLIDHALSIRNQVETLSIRFSDTDIRLGEENSALVTATLQVDSRGRDELFRDFREVALGMVQEDGDWLIGGVTLVQVLEK